MTIYNMDDDFTPFEPYEPYKYNKYFNAITITWGELRDGGFIDWDEDRFSWDYFDEEQKARLEEMMDRRFWLREISIIPPEAWRISFIGKLNEAMRTASLMYQILKDRPNILTQLDEYHKSRSIGSDFPATLLNGSTGDYASDGRDYEYETVRDGDILTAMNLLQEFRHPDIYILDKLEGCFSNLVTVNLNGF